MDSSLLSVLIGASPGFVTAGVAAYIGWLNHKVGTDNQNKLSSIEVHVDGQLSKITEELQAARAQIVTLTATNEKAAGVLQEKDDAALKKKTAKK